jgi:hypothetical protein
MIRIFVALAVFAALASDTAKAAELSPSDLRRLFPGTYSVTIFNSFTLRVNMRRNGDMTGFAKGRSDTGRWSIEGKQLCIAWTTWTKGKKGCSALRRDGNLLRGRGFYFKT